MVQKWDDLSTVSAPLMVISRRGCLLASKEGLFFGGEGTDVMMYGTKGGREERLCGEDQVVLLRPLVDDPYPDLRKRAVRLWRLLYLYLTFGTAVVVTVNDMNYQPDAY